MNNPVFNYMSMLVSRKREAGKESTADMYRAMRNRLLRCPVDKLSQWDDITTSLVDSFAEWLYSDGLAVNTVNSYLSNFRAIYHTAVREGEIPKPDSDPFSHLRLKREETAKRALKIKEVNKVMQAQYTENTPMRQALDLFIFCYLACGMPFVDLAYLTKKNIVGNEIVYHRRKNGVLVRVAITPAMRMLMRKYAQKKSAYLFPVLTAGRDGHEDYKSALHAHNSLLKTIGVQLRLHTQLTTYVARHSWATEALRQNIPVAVISQALGHTSEKTTRIYLDSLDQSVLNRANRKVTKKASQLLMERG